MQTRLKRSSPIVSTLYATIARGQKVADADLDRLELPDLARRMIRETASDSLKLGPHENQRRRRLVEDLVDALSETLPDTYADPRYLDRTDDEETYDPRQLADQVDPHVSTGITRSHGRPNGVRDLNNAGGSQ